MQSIERTNTGITHTNVSQTPWMRAIINKIKSILKANRTPEEIYQFLETLTKEIFLQTSLYQKKYKLASDSQTYVQDICNLLIGCIKKDPYFSTTYGSDIRRSIMTSSSIVNGIPAHHIKDTKAHRLHDTDPEKYYSISSICFMFSLPERDKNRFLANCIPVSIDLIQNGMTDIEEQYQFLLYKDIIIKYHEGLDTFFYDTISLIKESNIADPNCFDGFNVRKLVGVTKPFPLFTPQKMIS